MVCLAILAALASATVTLALPQPVLRRQVPNTLPNSTTVTYWQGSGSCDIISTGTGTLSSYKCAALLTESISISQQPRADCSLWLWKGSNDCTGEVYSTFPIPRGNGSVCVDTGDLDGGKFYPASGRWSCDCDGINC